MPHNAFLPPERPWTDADEREYRNLGSVREAPTYAKAAALKALAGDVDVSKLSDEEFAARYAVIGARDRDFDWKLNASGSSELRAEKAYLDEKAAEKVAAENGEIERLREEAEVAHARRVLAEAEVKKLRERSAS